MGQNSPDQPLFPPAPAHTHHRLSVATSDPSPANPSTQAEMSLTFNCAVCLDRFDSTPIAVVDDTICGDCCTTGLVPQFDAALKDETKYPVKWNGHTLDINDFHTFFSAPFLREWMAKTAEYQTPIADRLYCAGGNCGRYLGLRSQHDPQRYCMACGGLTCANCSASILSNQHECKPNDQSDPFEGLQRGHDYQSCPTCGIKACLISGCNHVVCGGSGACSTNYCFVCGEEAADNSGHWGIGRPCPRYNQPGADNAVFDRPAINLDANLDNVVLTRLHQGMRTAQFEPIPPPDAPQEVRSRHADRQTLHRISSQALQMAQQDSGGDAQRMVSWLVCVGLLASGLITAIDVYTIHLEPDQDSRWIDLASVELIHPFIQQWYYQAGDQGLFRFPELVEIYEHYLWARTARLREQAEESGL